MAPERLESTLSHLRVIDLTRARAGPAAARQFADWGADVIRIEPIGQSMYTDMGRRHGADFQNLHRNKRGLTLDLKQDDGKAVLKRLVETADVVLENFRPDVKYRLGIDYESLACINPRIVYGSISGFGQDGPYANRPGLDQIIQGMGGHMMVTGEPGRGPMRSGAAISDMFAGLLCASGVLAALLERERSGTGQWVNTSLLEAQIFLLDFQAARWLMSADLPAQEGNDHPVIMPMGVYATSDGYVNIAPLPDMWRRFCEAIGDPALATDERFTTNEGRRANKEDLNKRIDAALTSRTCQEWIDRLNEARVPCGPIYRIDEMFEDPQVVHLGMATTVHSRAMGRELSLVRQPLRMSRFESRIDMPAPEAGEHVYEILAEAGYGAEEIESLRERGVV